MLATQNGRSNPVRISCKRSEKLKSISLMTLWRRRSRRGLAFVSFAYICVELLLFSNALPDFFSRESRDSDHFLAAGLAGSNGNGRTRHLQKFCEEFDAGLIGTAFDG